MTATVTAAWALAYCLVDTSASALLRPACLLPEVEVGRCGGVSTVSTHLHTCPHTCLHPRSKWGDVVVQAVNFDMYYPIEVMKGVHKAEGSTCVSSA